MIHWTSPPPENFDRSWGSAREAARIASFVPPAIEPSVEPAERRDCRYRPGAAAPSARESQVRTRRRPGDLLGARAADLPIYASRELHDPDPRSWAILLFSGLMRLLSPRRPSAAGTPALARAGLALILGGTDRAAVGYVVDFVVSTWRTRRSRWGRSR